MRAQTGLEQAREILRTHFGFEDFREGQEEVVSAVLEGHDCVVVRPTGGGKSLCYQLPALMLPGKTLVVSPLIALMKDQGESLERKKIAATFINSSLPLEEQQKRLRAFALGDVKILFIAPERFRSAHFTDVLREQEISLFAVDEAHCISHWGHDFRPEYLRLRSVIEALGQPQVIALTATATPLVRLDIIEQLNLRAPAIFVAGFDRENLRLRVTLARGKKVKLHLLKDMIREPGGVGIVYAATRRAVTEISDDLKACSLNVAPYHAGMSTVERETVQDRFMRGDLQAIVATNAFGMGIDKPDIRFVIHYNIPGAIEDYYQEIGRAGRDGRPSDCVLLYDPSDIKIQEFFLEGDNPHPDLIASVYAHLLQRPERPMEVTLEQIRAGTGARNPLTVNTALSLLERAGHIRVLRRSIDESDPLQIFLLDDSSFENLRIDKTELARRAALNQWKLRMMIEYAHYSGCLRGFILQYFGDKKQLDYCGVCSNCHQMGHRGTETRRTLKRKATIRLRDSELDQFIVESAPVGRALRRELKVGANKLRGLEKMEESRAPTRPGAAPERDGILQWEPARQVLECVAALNNRYGKSTIAAVLAGSRRRSIRQSRLDRSPFHGRLAHLAGNEITKLLNELLQRGYLMVNQCNLYPVLALNERGRKALEEIHRS